MSEKIPPFPKQKWRPNHEFIKEVEEWRVTTRDNLPEELDRLAENIHDFLVKELKVPLKPYAKLLQPIIWGWAEKGILGALGGEQ